MPISSGTIHECSVNPEDGEPTATICEVCGSFECSFCDEVFGPAELIGTNSWGEHGCSNCMIRCSNCTEMVSRYDAYDGMCEECYDRLNDDEDEDEFVEMFDDPDESTDGREPIRNYSYKPSPIFFGGRPDTLLNFGIEHELEFPSSSAVRDGLEVVYRHNRPLGSPFYVKSDGSINCGFEMVSHPMTREWFDTTYPQDMIRELQALGASPTATYGEDTSGIHIHISKDSFTTYHLYKFLHFHYEFAELIQRIAGRKSDQWASFSKDKSMGAPKSTRKADGNFSTSYAPKLRLMASKKAMNQTRYVAVNLLNEATVELRYFRSTGKIERVRAYVQFVDAVWRYTKLASITKKAKSSRIMSEADFIAWVHESADEFPDLSKFLNRDPDYRPDAKMTV